MSLTRDFPDLPPIWALGTAAAQWAVARMLPIWSFDLPWLGTVLGVAGFALVGWAGAWFLRKRTSFEPRDTPTTLIIEGPFRVNRNPIYTGMAAILLGWGVWLGALSALLLVPVFTWVIGKRFIDEEEATLRAAFGAEAEDYIAKSRRW